MAAYQLISPITGMVRKDYMKPFFPNEWSDIKIIKILAIERNLSFPD